MHFISKLVFSVFYEFRNLLFYYTRLKPEKQWYLFIGLQKRSGIPGRSKEDRRKHKKTTKNQKRQFLATPLLGATPAVLPTFPATALHPAVAQSPLIPATFPSAVHPLFPVQPVAAMPFSAYAQANPAYPATAALPLGHGLFPSAPGLLPVTAFSGARAGKRL